ncbi:Sedlin [Serendipita vermifera]|nr:Sedlin [Serendipita vermifera]
MADKNIKIRAVAFISPQNYPMFVRSYGDRQEDEIKHHYIAHSALDVFEERLNANPKATECFVGMLFILEDVCVYGYITPTRVKMVVALDQTDHFIKDEDVILIFKALHGAYHAATSNPFLQLSSQLRDPKTEQITQIMGANKKWNSLQTRVDQIVTAGNSHLSSSE